MSKEQLYRWWKLTLVVLTLLLAAFSAAVQSGDALRAALVLAVVVYVAVLLRSDAGDASIGFEAAVGFGAIVIFHSPAIALIAVFAGATAYACHDALIARRFRIDPFFAAAQLALSYSTVGLLYALAVATDADPQARIAGFALLLVAYPAVELLFLAVRRQLEGESSPDDFRRALLREGKTLLFVTPIVAVEVMLYPIWGLAGFLVAFLPLVIVAYAMRNEAEASRQNVELVRRNRDLALLTESSTQILSAESDQETLQRLMALLSRLAKLKACAVVTWETNPEVPGTVYRFGECMPTDQEILRWVDYAGLTQSAPSRAFVFQSEMRKFPLSSGSATQVLIGIQTPEVIYGILLFETEDLSILKAGSLNLLTLLVNQTALSLQDQLLRREMREKTLQLESHAATMSAILDVSNGLIGQFELDAALTRISLAIRSALGFQKVVFALRDAPRGNYVRRAHAGMDDVWEEARKKHVSYAEIERFLDPEFAASHSYFVSHTALRRSEGDFFVRADSEDSFLRPDEWHDNDMLLVPLMSGEQMIGYLSVREPSDRRIPSLEKVQTLEVFATQAVTAVQSAGQYEEIRRLTFIDALTPAYNHRYFQDALAKEIHRHTRTGREMALAMLDLDNFKRINDSFGHPVGDEILKGLVDELMEKGRDTDVVSRYGGEEFAIILPDTPAASARDAANRLRELVARREFPLPHLDRTLFITVSIGVAVFPRDGNNATDLIARADAALYAAKKQGRNRVVMAEELGEAGEAAG